MTTGRPGQLCSRSGHYSPIAVRICAFWHALEKLTSICSVFPSRDLAFYAHQKAIDVHEIPLLHQVGKITGVACLEPPVDMPKFISSSSPNVFAERTRSEQHWGPYFGVYRRLGGVPLATVMCLM